MPTRPHTTRSPDDFWAEVVLTQISAGQSTEIANRSANTLALEYAARLTASPAPDVLPGLGFESELVTLTRQDVKTLGLAPHPDRVIAWLAEDIGELPWAIDEAGLTRAADNELIDEHDDPAFVAAVNAACARVQSGDLAAAVTHEDGTDQRAGLTEYRFPSGEIVFSTEAALESLGLDLTCVVSVGPPPPRSGEAGLTLTGEMSDGELGLELDVDGHKDTTWLSRATYDAIGVAAGWASEPAAPDMKAIAALFNAAKITPEPNAVDGRRAHCYSWNDALEHVYAQLRELLTTDGEPLRAAECADLFSPPAPDTLSRLQRIHDAGEHALEALAREYERPPGRYGDALRRELLGCELSRAREYSTLQKDYTPVSVEWRDLSPSSPDERTAAYVAHELQRVYGSARWCEGGEVVLSLEDATKLAHVVATPVSEQLTELQYATGCADAVEASKIALRVWKATTGFEHPPTTPKLKDAALEAATVARARHFFEYLKHARVLCEDVESLASHYMSLLSDASNTPDAGAEALTRDLELQAKLAAVEDALVRVQQVLDS